MANKARVAAALKALPPGTRGSIAPQSSGMGRVSPVQSEMYYQNPYQGSYGPFMVRQPEVFSDGAFSPMPPIQPVPVDQPPRGGMYPDPRYLVVQPGYNLPTPPGSEGFKLASFDQLRVLSERYSVARACIELRIEEIRGLTWEITMTKEAAKAYQGSHSLMKSFGERAAEATRFFKRPDRGYWNFDSFLNAMLEEIFVYDALCLIFRPKYGAKFGMNGKGLLGSDLDTLRLVPGPTIRPLVDLHGDPPAPPNPAYQQYLFGVPRSDYQTIMYGDDIEAYGIAGEHVAEYRSDLMLYAPYWPRRESPYGFPPVERALLPIVSGLQKQEFQLDYFKEGSVPAVYISPGDPNITPTQIRELQDALNGIAGDPAFHLKVVVLPPGSKVDPQRPVDLSDSFDQLVMEQVCMAFDVQPMELGIIPDIGGGQQGPSASAIRFAAQETRDIKSRKSTKPLLKFVCDIFNMVLQDICGQDDMRFQFEGLADDEDKQAITELGVQQVQNGIASIDEVRDRLDLAPWGLQETSEPVVFTAQGPIPFSMAPQLILAAQQAAGGGNSGNGSSGSKKPNNRTQSTNSGQRTSQPKTKQPAIRAGGQTKPNGSHPAPISPHRESLTPGHSAAAGAVQSPTPRTGGTPSRSSVAGSRKKAVMSELDALKRHLRKDRNAVYSWEPRHIETIVLAKIADDLNDGVLIDVAVQRAEDSFKEEYIEGVVAPKPLTDSVVLPEWHVKVPEAPDSVRLNVGAGIDYIQDNYITKKQQWPGWERDLGLVGAYKEQLGNAFKAADSKADDIRKQAASGKMYVDAATLRSLIAEEVHETFTDALRPLWAEAWHLGYESAKSLVTGADANFTAKYTGEALDNFMDTEGAHWVDKIARTGLIRANARAEVIARTEVARAMNAAAIQAYRDNGVAYKHLLVAPDDTCDVCKAARKEGVIPLDAIFPAGGLGGPFHPQCRCVPAPAGVELEPPQAHLGKSEKQDDSRAAFLMLRSIAPATGKRMYLLQKRDDGPWGLPGGTTHVGESPWDAAVRESTEEIGDLPVMLPEAHMVFPIEDKTIHVFVCSTNFFTPKGNGETAFETHGTAWFKRKEVKDLDLHPHFKEQWKAIDWEDLGKRISNTVNGEMQVTDPEAGELYPAGARWPYPKRSDGAENPHYGTAATETFPSRDPSRNTPAAHGPVDMADEVSTRVYGPEGDETTDFPRRRTRNRGPKKLPSQQPPMSQPVTDRPEGGPSSVGGQTGVPPSGERKASNPTALYHDLLMGRIPLPKAGPKPVVGSVPAEAPRPMSPHAEAPVTYDPAEAVAVDTDEGDAYYPQPKKKNKSGPSDYSDPNPVDSEHVYVQMAKNFPPKAIEWIRRARWIGPVNIPWDRIDSDDIESWAASHQPEKVKEFENMIKAHSGHVAPSVTIQDNDSPKAIIIDGHHRALARKNLNMPVLSYVGMIDPKDRKAAEETHAQQVHSGSDPKNT